jgi:hypothetical protein
VLGPVQSRKGVTAGQVTAGQREDERYSIRSGSSWFVMRFTSHSEITHSTQR